MEFAEPSPRLNLPSTVQLFQPCFWTFLIWKCQEITFLPSTGLLQVSAVKMPSLPSHLWRQLLTAWCYLELEQKVHKNKGREVLMLSQTYGVTWKWLSQVHLFSLVFRKGKKDGEAKVCTLKGFAFGLCHCFSSQVLLSEAVKKEGDSASYSLWVK